MTSSFQYDKLPYFPVVAVGVVHCSSSTLPPNLLLFKLWDTFVRSQILKTITRQIKKLYNERTHEAPGKYFRHSMLFKIGDRNIKDTKSVMENFSLCASNNTLKIRSHTKLPDHHISSTIFVHFIIFAVGNLFNCNNGHFITVGLLCRKKEKWKVLKGTNLSRYCPRGLVQKSQASVLRLLLIFFCDCTAL